MTVTRVLVRTQSVRRHDQEVRAGLWSRTRRSQGEASEGRMGGKEADRGWRWTSQGFRVSRS